MSRFFLLYTCTTRTCTWYPHNMNPTEMSGDDLCEQPILQTAELRALAGLGVAALLLFVGIQASSPLEVVSALPAAALQAVEITPSAAALEQPLEWVTLSESTSTMQVEETAISSTTPVIESIN